jgi:hypothetical protein
MVDMIYFFLNILQDNIDLWNNMKDSLYYLTIITGVQTLFFIYYITFKLPRAPYSDEQSIVTDLDMDDLTDDKSTDYLLSANNELDSVLESLNRVEKELDGIRDRFEASAN